MLFNSLAYALFLPAVLLAYYALRRDFRRQNALLLAASYFFYGWWDVRFLFLIVLSTVVDYSCALSIDEGRLTRSQQRKALGFLLAGAFLSLAHAWPAGDGRVDGLEPFLPFLVSGAAVLAAFGLHRALARMTLDRRRRVLVFTSVVTNLAILGVFKYFDFFAENLHALFEGAFGVTLSPWTLNVVLPVGISFYTFQTMSYTIDVYRGSLRASGSLLNVAAYVAFFPQLVAGPIERGSHLLPQFEGPRAPLSADDRNQALWLIAWGLFKKMVVADNMALIVNRTFGPFDELGAAAAVPADGLRLLIGVYAFAFQIYGDFSGYTDIARGSARLFGFDLMLNFRLPYFATDPSDFWRRWHISLSTWLRDYLYIPLGGNRGSAVATNRNLAITMLLGGLWHGAAWTFVIWGAYHGLLLVLFRRFRGASAELRISARQMVQAAAFFQLTCLGWLIFRAQNVATISSFLEAIFLNPGWSAQATADLRDFLLYGWFLFLVQLVQGVTGRLDFLEGRHWFVRLNAWFVAIFSILVFGREGAVEFIYFAF